MAIRLALHAGDVTQLPESRPAPNPNTVPARDFIISHGESGFSLEYDGRSAIVPFDEVQNLLVQVSRGGPTTWQHSSAPELTSAFRPLRRILPCINSTPAFQLFLAGLHIADAIGMFDLGQVRKPAIADSFRYLIGQLLWSTRRKGRLFFIPDGYVTPDVENELVANSKLVTADLYTGDDEAAGHVEHKLFVPYATPIGFSTHVAPETEETWQRICQLVRSQGAGPVQ